MTTPALKFGCQTFTWEMLGARWTGGPDDLIRAVADGGYAGIEITDTMIGAFAGRPAAFGQRLADAGLQLISFAFGSASGFAEPDRIPAELEAARLWVDYAAHVPGALVSMGSATVMSGGACDGKFGVAAEIYNLGTEIGRTMGVTVAVYSLSHPNTLLSSRADHDRIFGLLDRNVGWVPDTGHILRGGQATQATLAAHRDRIRYVHLKDVDAAGNRAMLGDGVCDVAAVTAAVGTAPNFIGWIVVEEESQTAAVDPATAVRANLATLRRGFAGGSAP